MSLFHYIHGLASPENRDDLEPGGSRALGIAAMAQQLEGLRVAADRAGLADLADVLDRAAEMAAAEVGPALRPEPATRVA